MSNPILRNILLSNFVAFSGGSVFGAIDYLDHTKEYTTKNDTKDLNNYNNKTLAKIMLYSGVYFSSICLMVNSLFIIRILL